MLRYSFIALLACDIDAVVSLRIFRTYSRRKLAEESFLLQVKLKNLHIRGWAVIRHPRTPPLLFSALLFPTEAGDSEFPSNCTSGLMGNSPWHIIEKTGGPWPGLRKCLYVEALPARDKSTGGQSSGRCIWLATGHERRDNQTFPGMCWLMDGS